VTEPISEEAIETTLEVETEFRHYPRVEVLTAVNGGTIRSTVVVRHIGIARPQTGLVAQRAAIRFPKGKSARASNSGVRVEIWPAIEVQE
jgi:hypothetical protein